MKWKKKSNSWRAQDEYCQYVIEEIEGGYHPKIKMPDGNWEAYNPYSSIEEAKKYCEQLSVLHNEMEIANKKLVDLRREQANNCLTRREQRLKEAVKKWIDAPEVDKIYLREHLPKATVNFLDMAEAEIKRSMNNGSTSGEEGTLRQGDLQVGD